MPELSSNTYSEIDASNNQPAPNGMPEGMPPSGVNDAWRAGMGALKRFWDRINGTVTATGSAGAYVYTPASTAFPTALVPGESYAFRANGAAVGNDTLNVNALGAKPLYKATAAGPARLAAGDIQTGQMVLTAYDANLNAGGGGFHVLAGVTPAVFTGGALTAATTMSGAAFNEAQATIAAAATVNIGAAAANYLTVTGATAITAFDAVPAGTTRELEFQGALTLTHNAASLIMPGAANVTTAAGDVAKFRSEGSGNWRCVKYMKANGQPTVPATGTLTAGTQAVLNPYALGSLTTQAHGLGAAPTRVDWYLECVTAELGWSVGERIHIINESDGNSGTTGLFIVSADATNTYIATIGGGATPFIFNKSARNALLNLTAANWKLVATPYKLN